MKVKTLLLVAGLSISILVGGAFAFRANMILQSSLQAERVEQQRILQDYNNLRSTLNLYLHDLRAYSKQIDSALVDVAPAVPSSDLLDFHDTSELAQLTTARILLQRDLEVTAQLNDFFKITRPFLFNIPSLWPIKSGGGVITMQYGLNLNPFSGQPYIHSGVDITTFRAGEPVVATADGTVAYAGYSSNLGNHVVIIHAYGFHTVYGHFQVVAVHIGQKVSRGWVVQVCLLEYIYITRFIMEQKH